MTRSPSSSRVAGFGERSEPSPPSQQGCAVIPGAGPCSGPDGPPAAACASQPRGESPSAPPEGRRGGCSVFRRELTCEEDSEREPTAKQVVTRRPTLVNCLRSNSAPRRSAHSFICGTTVQTGRRGGFERTGAALTGWKTSLCHSICSPKHSTDPQEESVWQTSIDFSQFSTLKKKKRKKERKKEKKKAA